MHRSRILSICLISIALMTASTGAAAAGCARLFLHHSSADAHGDGPDHRERLFSAAASGCIELVDLLLDEGTGIDSRDAAGNTPLLIAVVKNRPATASILLDRGANPNVGNNLGLRPLTAAAFKGSETLVAHLLQAGARTNLSGPGYKGLLSPVAHAARKGHQRILELLLEHGLDVNDPCGRGRTALIWAVDHYPRVSTEQAMGIATMLLERGIDVDLADNIGRTALMVATKRGHFEIVTLLLQWGANPLHTDNYGLTAIELTEDPDILDALGLALKTAPPIVLQ